MFGDLAFVGDDDNRGTLLVQLFKEGEDRLAVDAVEVAGRLVREHDRRTTGKRTGDRDALALASRKLVRTGVPAMRESDLGERLVGELATFAERHARIEQSVGDVVERALVIR